MGMVFCRGCGKEIHETAPSCPHCGALQGLIQSNSTMDSAVVKPSADYEVLLLAIPVVTTMLMLLWVANMNLLQSPGDTLILLSILTVVGTAIVASLEASKVGMKSDRKKGTSGPVAWFFSFILIWILAYPMYLYKRKYYGLNNRLILGILVACIFLGSATYMNSIIEDKKVEVMDNLGMLKESQTIQEPQKHEDTNPSPPDLASLIGQAPSDALEHIALKAKFQEILGDKFNDFNDRLNVSSGIQQQGEWLVGEGGMPHLFSIEEAAFAVNTTTAEVFAIMLTEGKDITWYGASEVSELPVPLQHWFQEHKNQ